MRNEASFEPKRVLIVKKLSRYYFEKLREPDLNEEELKVKLEERGSDYELMLASHIATNAVKNEVIEHLKKLNIEYRVVNRYTFIDLYIHLINFFIKPMGFILQGKS